MGTDLRGTSVSPSYCEHTIMGVKWDEAALFRLLVAVYADIGEEEVSTIPASAEVASAP